MTQEHIDQIDPARANFTSAIARLLPQSQTMLLDFQKLPIDRKNVGRALRSRRSQFAFGMCQDFFEVPRHCCNLAQAVFLATLAIARASGGRRGENDEIRMV